MDRGQRGALSASSASGYANLFAQLVHIYQSFRGTRVCTRAHSHRVRALACSSVCPCRKKRLDVP